MSKFIPMQERPFTCQSDPDLTFVPVSKPVPIISMKDLLPLLHKLKKIKASNHEPTLLGIGGRGYYENPCSDLLAFFLASENAETHGLGTVFLDALWKSAGISDDLRREGSVRVTREKRTGNGNRIDLMLKGDGWIMLIENKIRHFQANPFGDYEDLADKEMCEGDRRLFLILSPGGEANPDYKEWKGLSYRKLINTLKSELEAFPVEGRTNKWWHFAHDFITHLHQELYYQPMNPEEVIIAREHYNQLKTAKQLLERYENHRGQMMLEKLRNEFPNEDIHHKNTWSHHYTSPLWNPSYPVWWFEEGSGNPRINMTVYLNWGTEEQIEKAHKAFVALGDYVHSTETNCHLWRKVGLTDDETTEAIFIESVKVLRSLYVG